MTQPPGGGPPNPIQGRFGELSGADTNGAESLSVYGGDHVAGAKTVYNFNGGFGQPFPAGFHPYSVPLLDSFRPFVRPAGLDRVAALLREGPVAALRGPAGLGKQAAALGLLTELGAQRFYGVDPDVGFPAFDPVAVAAGSGLVLDGLPAAAAARLRRFDLDRVGQVLARRDSWLVITLDESVDWADPGLAELTAELSERPPARAVIEVHLCARLGPLRAARAQTLLDHPRLAGQIEALPAGLRCAEAAELGRLLAEHSSDPDTAADRFRLLADARGGRELADWFANLPDLPTRFFAIALAFAEGEPVETVAAIADELERRFRTPSRVTRPARPRQPGDNWFGDERFAPGQDPRDRVGSGPVAENWFGDDLDGAPAVTDQWAEYRDSGDPFHSGSAVRLRDVRAVVGPRIVRTSFGPIPVQGAQFVDQGYARSLLRHVWIEYGQIRPALTGLMEGLGAHPSPAVRRRAALAVGALARNAGSFDQVRAAIVTPWAAAEDGERNHGAALALGVAGEDGALAGPIRRLVRAWVEAEIPGLRATAARALGRQVGGIGQAEAAGLLTELAADEHEAVADAVCRSLTGRVGRALVVRAESSAADLAGAELESGGGNGNGSATGIGTGSGDDGRGNGETGTGEDLAAGDDEAAAAVFGLVEQWTGHRDVRVRRTAQLTVLGLVTDLTREGDPHTAGLVRAGRTVGRRLAAQRPAAPGGEASWPGLLWFAERGPDLSRQVGRLWAAVLTSAEFSRPAKQVLDQWAGQVEHSREHREALGRLLFAAAERERVRRILGRRAAAWARPPGAAAPRTGALVISLLNIS
jgi:hypothetical protein